MSDNKKITLIMDSGGDLDLEIVKKNNIVFLPMKYEEELENNEIVTKELDVSPRTYLSLYEEITTGEKINIIPPSKEDFMSLFMNELSKGNDIIYISSSGLFYKNYDTALVALEEMIQKDLLKDNTIKIIDSKTVSLGYGLIMLEAAKLRDEGLSILDITKEIEKLTGHIKCYFTCDRLRNFNSNLIIKKGSPFNELFGFYPVLTFNEDGKLEILRKVRTKEKTIEYISKMIKENSSNNETKIIGISHTNNIEEAINIGESLKNELAFKDVLYSYINPISCRNISEDIIGVFYIE